LVSIFLACVRVETLCEIANQVFILCFGQLPRSSSQGKQASMTPFAASLFGAVSTKSAVAFNYFKGLGAVEKAYTQQPPTCGFDNIGALLPDASSIVVTQQYQEATRQSDAQQWDMCKDKHSCKHGEAQGHIVFGFSADSLVVEFMGPQGYDHVSYSDIDIWIERTGPETSPSQHFNLRDGVCRRYQNSFRCGIPFKAIGASGRGGMCSRAGYGVPTLKMKVEAVANVDSKKFGLFSRSSGDPSGWFSLSYSCTK
jgi:hypothetical protein